MTTAKRLVLRLASDVVLIPTRVVIQTLRLMRDAELRTMIQYFSEVAKSNPSWAGFRLHLRYSARQA